jgi:hypothetical protein
MKKRKETRVVITASLGAIAIKATTPLLLDR